MLDNNGQIRAFQILSAAGYVRPETLNICDAANQTASDASKTILGLLLENTPYPSSVSEYTAKLPGLATELDGYAASALALRNAIEPYIEPSALLQMKIGWECHIKGHEITPEPPFALVYGLGDTETPAALRDGVQALSLNALSEAMTAINAKVRVNGGGSGSSGEGETAPPVISQKEIDALIAAINDVEKDLNEIQPAGELVSLLADEVNMSTGQATHAMNSAIAIALTDGLAGDPVMLPAVTLIMPEGVIDAIRPGS